MLYLTIEHLQLMKSSWIYDHLWAKWWKISFLGCNRSVIEKNDFFLHIMSRFVLRHNKIQVPSRFEMVTFWPLSLLMGISTNGCPPGYCSNLEKNLMLGIRSIYSPFWDMFLQNFFFCKVTLYLFTLMQFYSQLHTAWY